MTEITACVHCGQPRENHNEFGSCKIGLRYTRHTTFKAGVVSSAPKLPLHPDDVLFFTEVKDAMFRVAKRYQLPLRSVTAMSMPLEGMIDRMGDCSGAGDIRLVMRCTVDGEWCSGPLQPNEVWDTAAHELAHLKHMDHREAFQTLRLELVAAMQNQKEDHREKLIKKLVKLQKSRDGEKSLGNSAAAEAFAGMINKLMIENELHPSELDYVRAADDDPVIEVPVNLEQYKIKKKHARVAWQETMARVVAKAHLCTFLIRPGSNSIWFVGTKSHATVAEYAYGTLVRSATLMCKNAYRKYGDESARAAGKLKGRLFPEPGFRESWFAAFISRVEERMDVARKEAVTEAAADVPGAESQALMRLDGALQKARKYVDDKFKGRGASALTGKYNRGNAAGRAAGRAAADSLTLGRKGVTSGVRGLIAK